MKIIDTHCVYIIENLITNKLYIGYTKNPEKRWSDHLSIAQGGPEKNPRAYSYIHKSINKYGKENFIFTIIEYFNSEKEGKNAEIYWIRNLKEQNIQLYNLTDGGDGISGYTYTSEQLEALSNRMLGKFDGDKNPFFGKKHSDETKKIISEDKKIKFLDPEFKAKYSGENHSNNKLTKEIVKEIKEKYFYEGFTRTELEILFNTKSISPIVGNKIWKEIKIDMSKALSKEDRKIIVEEKLYGKKITENCICEICSKTFQITYRENGVKLSGRFCSKDCKNSGFGSLGKTAK